MPTHTTRPAVALAWVLGLILLFTRPEIAVTVLAAVSWTLTAPAGVWILGTAFIAAVACVIRGARGWSR